MFKTVIHHFWIVCVQIDIVSDQVEGRRLSITPQSWSQNKRGNAELYANKVVDSHTFRVQPKQIKIETN